MFYYTTELRRGTFTISDKIKEYAWLTKEELKDTLDTPTYDAVEPLLAE
jgi:hypothetical protein